MGCGTILQYHRLIDRKVRFDDFEPNLMLAVHQIQFEEQMSLLAAQKTPMHLSDLLENPSSDAVAVTFDDGYRDNLTLALPVLERFEVPATIYVTPGMIDGTCRAWWLEHEDCLRSRNSLSFNWRGHSYEWKLRNTVERYAAGDHLNRLFKAMDLETQREASEVLYGGNFAPRSYADQMLSWDEIKELAQHPLIRIGAHTVSHPVLSRLQSNELEWELDESKAILEAKIACAVEDFCFPFGGINEAAEREYSAAREVGYKSATTSIFGHLSASDLEYPWKLPRIIIDYLDTIESFELKLSGLAALARTPLVSKLKELLTGTSSARPKPGEPGSLSS